MKFYLFTIAIAMTAAASTTFASPCPETVASSCSLLKTGYVCGDEVAGAFSAGDFENRCHKTQGSAYAAANCTTTGVVGSCVYYFPDSRPYEVVRYYAPAPADKIAQICANNHGTVCE